MAGYGRIMLVRGDVGHPNSERLDCVSKSLRFSAIGICAVLVAISPVRAQPPATAPTTLPNGTWTVQGREILGTRCGHWLVRLINTQGRLSGVVSLARASVPIQNLTLMPDGSFTGTTLAGVVGSRHARAYRVSGRFSGDAVHLTFETDTCPPRQGAATRQ